MFSQNVIYRIKDDFMNKTEKKRLYHIIIFTERVTYIVGLNKL